MQEPKSIHTHVNYLELRKAGVIHRGSFHMNNEKKIYIYIYKDIYFCTEKN